MATQDKGIDSEESGDSVDSSQECDETVPKIFKEIFDSNITKLSECLAIINKNTFGTVWSGEEERHVKTIKYSKEFVSGVLNAFRVHYESASKEILEGSACDKFQNYILKHLSSAVEKTGMLEKSFYETKQEFIQKISVIKENFEKKEVKETAPKSDIDDVISNTDLMNPVHINHALLCCRVAYECKDLEKPEQCLRTFPDKHWLSELVVSYQSPAVPRYVMARCGNVLYVAFRGLDSEAKTIAAGSVMPHTNWRGQTNSIIFNEAEKVPLSYFAREIFLKKRIVFTGHSTGGAIASLVVIYLLDKLRGIPTDYIKSSIKCITFGITPVGDKRLKELVESIPAMKECFCHIVKNNDIIPKLFGSNLEDLQDCLLDLVLSLSQMSIEMVGMIILPEKVVFVWDKLMKYVNVPQNIRTQVRKLLPLFEIFGQYYVLNPTATEEQKFSICSGEEANEKLSLDLRDISGNYKDYLVNHRIERYDSDVRQCLPNKYPEGLSNLPCSDTMKPSDIFPDVRAVQLENIGGEMIAKVDGTNLWFVHEVKICGIEPIPDDQQATSPKRTSAKGESFAVDISKNTESLVVINMGTKHIRHEGMVNARVKMHFQDSRYIEAKDIQARTMLYEVSKRQEQVAKLSPSMVIELAHLSALLERRVSSANEKCDRVPRSKRYADVKKFFESVISVVPAESIFHAMAVSKPYTVLQCCQLLSEKKELFDETVLSKFLSDGMQLAQENLSLILSLIDNAASSEEKTTAHHVFLKMNYLSQKIHKQFSMLDWSRSIHKVADHCHGKVSTGEPNPLEMAKQFIERKLEHRKSRRSLCGLNMEEVYSQSQVKVSSFSIEHHPLILLKNGRDELNALSKKMSFESRSTENANSEMLEKLNDLRENFRTCSTLLGSFMEAHVHVPLELQDVNEARKIVTAAESGGLKVWMLLVLPVSYVKKFMKRILKESQKLLVDVSSYMCSLYPGQRYGFLAQSSSTPDSAYYAGKLEFLMTSMKKSSSSNKSFIAYSLERQLVLECEKRNIKYETELDTILQQWNENFEDEALTMVDEDYRPLIARWIKWSLMINQLRESLAEQTAVGVIGLVNSGKSKFVKSMFGIETISGTVAEKRTTVPYIYNLDGIIKGLDVIDFPGVDDKDKSIPELAELLLSLTRIIVFVVDYKRAHTKAAAQWLKILEKENVPVLVCLSFADKLFSEYMLGGHYPEENEVKSRFEEQLETITSHVGQSESGKRDFKFVVFDLDNDSCLNTSEGKKRLRQAGLHDEKEVGHWIAEKLRDNKDETLASRLLTFITEKESSVLSVEDEPGPSARKRSRSQSESKEEECVSPRSRTKIDANKRRSSQDQAMSSKDLP